MLQTMLFTMDVIALDIFDLYEDNNSSYMNGSHGPFSSTDDANEMYENYLDSCFGVGHNDKWLTDCCLNERCSENLPIHSQLLRDDFLSKPFQDVELSPMTESAWFRAEKSADSEYKYAYDDHTAHELHNCVDPNKIFLSDNSSKLMLSSASTPILNTSVPQTDSSSSLTNTSNVISTTYNNVDDNVDNNNTSYDDIWSDSDDEETPSSSSSPQPSEEEVDEIDVVSVPRPKSSSSAETAYESFNLPATLFMSERVAALHNYSTRPVQCLRPPVQKSASAPHSPSDRMVTVTTKRCLSNPASPASRRPHKRRRRGGQDHLKGRSKRFKADVDSVKREQHNSLERSRREKLASDLHELRDVLPELRGCRVSKWNILNKAQDYISELERLYAEHQSTLTRVRQERERLEARKAALSGSNGQSSAQSYGFK